MCWGNKNFQAILQLHSGQTNHLHMELGTLTECPGKQDWYNFSKKHASNYRLQSFIFTVTTYTSQCNGTVIPAVLQGRSHISVSAQRLSHCSCCKSVAFSEPSVHKASKSPLYRPVILKTVLRKMNCKFKQKSETMSGATSIPILLIKLQKSIIRNVRRILDALCHEDSHSG